MTTREQWETYAHTYLDEQTATQWLTFLRPAVRLVSGEGAQAPVVARLGGRPRLPDGVDWPRWDDHPLSFVAEVDLAAAATAALDAGRPLPRIGRLLVFQDTLDGYLEPVGSWDPATAPGARLLHVQGEGGDVAGPEGVFEFPEVPLRGAQDLIAPAPEQPQVVAAFADRPGALAALVSQEALEAIDEVAPRAHHLGGWALPVQGPVEPEAERWTNPDADEAPADVLARWMPLLQMESDAAAGMMWGDLGALYWLTRSPSGEDLGELAFAWQEA